MDDKSVSQTTSQSGSHPYSPCRWIALPLLANHPPVGFLFCTNSATALRGRTGKNWTNYWLFWRLMSVSNHKSSRSCWWLGRRLSVPWSPWVPTWWLPRRLRTPCWILLKLHTLKHHGTVCTNTAVVRMFTIRFMHRWQPSSMSTLGLEGTHAAGFHQGCVFRSSGSCPALVP